MYVILSHVKATSCPPMPKPAPVARRRIWRLPLMIMPIAAPMRWRAPKTWLLEAHKALGAYDVLNRLAAEGFGNQPPVVYRALEFLEDQGFAHRIRRLNAFVACMHPGETHAPAFLICRVCSTVAEAPAAPVMEALSHAAAHTGFAVERANVEALGLCPACKVAA